MKDYFNYDPRNVFRVQVLPCLNIGLKAIQNSTGKKCMGITNPGNNSGESSSKGSWTEKGQIQLKKVRVRKVMLNNTSVTSPSDSLVLRK